MSIEIVEIYAPWDPETVYALNVFQYRGGMHPFTCGIDSSHILVATENGWMCPHDNYTQNWALSMMVDIGRLVAHPAGGWNV